MKQFKIAMLLAVLCGTLATGIEAAEKPSDSPLSDNSIDAARKEARRDALLAPVRSEADLREYLRITAKEKNPLYALSDDVRERFLTSLVFTENGLGGFNYSTLASELTVAQTYKILSLFGAQSTTSLVGAKVVDDTDRAILAVPTLRGVVDYKDYKCSARATCSPSLLDICTGNC